MLREAKQLGCGRGIEPGRKSPGSPCRNHCLQHIVIHSEQDSVEVERLRRHGLARRPLLLRLLDSLRDLLRRQPCRRVVGELLHQPRHRCKDIGLFLVVHEPLHELRVNSLPLRCRSENGARRLHALDERLVDFTVAKVNVNTLTRNPVRIYGPKTRVLCPYLQGRVHISSLPLLKCYPLPLSVS